jgi:hypothetical protein
MSALYGYTLPTIGRVAMRTGERMSHWTELRKKENRQIRPFSFFPIDKNTMIILRSYHT